MTILTKSLKSLKQKLCRKLKVASVTRLTLKPQVQKRIQDLKTRCWTSTLVQQIIDKKEYRVIPVKKRVYKIYHHRKAKKQYSTVLPHVEHKRKPTSSLRYLLNRKIVNRKDLWMKKVRQMRSYLKSNRKILGSQYGKFRKKVKGNFYSNLQVLKRHCHGISKT